MKATGGGAYDPAARYLYFAAGGAHETGLRRVAGTWPPYVLVAVNDVLTESAEMRGLASHLDDGRPVLLDSGIFWLVGEHKRAHGCTMDEALALAPEEIDGFTELYDRYVELVHRYGDRLWGFIELDQGGAVNKRQTRARLESDGIIPMPVYHPIQDGWDYFDEIAGGYDRICLGNMVQTRGGERLRLMHAAWERRRAHPGLWIHVLGLTASEWCLSVPPDSCDSSRWLGPLRFSELQTEGSMLHRVQDLGLQFKYDLDNPAPGRDRAAAIGMCASAVASTNIVWQHAARRAAEVLGQAASPPYLPGEQPAHPSGSLVIVLLSGGLDSTVLATDMTGLTAPVEAISVNYGQRHAKELDAAAAVAAYLDIRHDVVDLTVLREHLAGSALTTGPDVPEGHYSAPSMAATVVPNRNAIMLSVAAGVAAARGHHQVATAVHAGDHPIYPDCRPEFIAAISLTVQLATAGYGDVEIIAPYVRMTKADIARRGCETGAPMHLSWSCYKGGERHCGRCGTCVERREAFDLEGIPDPATYADPEYFRTVTA